MRRTMLVGAWSLAIAAAILLPVPAQSSAPINPPSMPSFEGDYVIPPVGTPRTKMPPTVTVRGSTTYQSGMYDVYILAVDTDDGPAPWDEVEARRQVEMLDNFFDAETGGVFRFRLAGYQMLPRYPGSLCGLDDAFRHAAPEVADIHLTAGAVDALPVVVGRFPQGCYAAGVARLGSPGAWVSEDPTWVGYETKVFIHEIGHNLGLLHSGAAKEVFDGDPWDSEEAPPQEFEYGDASDVMGVGGQYACTYTSCVFNMSGLHGHNRNLLRGVPSDRIGYVRMPPTADDTGVIELTAEESGDAGVQVYYLPWKNRSMFMVEYRPALGQDRHLADEYAAGAGVHVRLVGYRVSSALPAYPDQPVEVTGTVAFPSGTATDEYSAIPLGFREGTSVSLPDGSLVQVVSTGPTKATVRVTRPADTSPPTMTPPRVEYAGGACTRYPCTVPVSALRKGKYRVWLTYGGFDDDQWVASVRASVNGNDVLVDDRPAPDGTDEETSMSPGSSYWGRWRTYGPGQYTITYTYSDLAGNIGTSSYQITLPKPKKRS